MIKNCYVREAILSCLEKGIRKFAIYPYGENGVNVRNILEECCDIESEYIIDNNLCRYKNGIISIEAFKQQISDEVYVFLTAENDQLNFRLEEELKKFIPGDRIINLLALAAGERYNCVNKYYLNSISTQFLRDNILPISRVKNLTDVLTEYKSRKSDRIKVRIHYFMHEEWNSIQTICESFEDDKKYDVIIILPTNNSPVCREKRIKLMQEGKHRYVLEEKYDVSIDKPNIYCIKFP